MSGGVRTCPVGVFWKDIFICPVGCGHVRWGPDLSGGSVLEGHIYLSGGVRTCPVGVFWKDTADLASPLDFSRPSL